MKVVEVGKKYTLKEHGVEILVMSAVEGDGVYGIMGQTLDDIMIPDPYGQYPARCLYRGAIIGVSIDELVIEGDNADFEHLLPSMDEVM